MKSFIFCEDPKILVKFATSADEIHSTLNRTSRGTDTTDLVVTIYFVAQSTDWGGHIKGRWETAANFFASRWLHDRSHGFSLPDDLPAKFKHIRMWFGSKLDGYPRKTRDKYGFIWEFQSFKDHLAFLFAHELHHFRRHQLALHPREGEISAEYWAFNHVGSLGFKASLISRKQSVRGKRKALPPHIEEAHKRLGWVRAGMLLEFTRPCDKDLRQGQLLKVLSPLRKNAYRINVETQDCRRYLVPAKFLAKANSSNPEVTGK